MYGTFSNLFFSAFLVLYLLPCLLALFRRHPRMIRVALLNVFGGWTMVGWVMALWWALVPPTEPGGRESPLEGTRL